jgi:hypothetical protein
MGEKRNSYRVFGWKALKEETAAIKMGGRYQNRF